MNREGKYQAMAGIVAAMLFVGIGRMALAKEGQDPAEEDRSKLAMMLDLLRSDDVRISFYGKVIDQGGAPVSGAKVELDVPRFADDEASLFGGSKSMELITDVEGLFSVEGERGSGVYIHNIGKLGYDSFQGLNPEFSFEYTKEDDRPVHEPDKLFPVIFRLRKMGDATFCIIDEYFRLSITTNTRNARVGYDFVQRMVIRNFDYMMHNSTPLVCDIQARGVYDTNSSSWAMIISSGSTNGGVIATDQLLYEAPETGYQAEYKIVPEDRRPAKDKYIYLKSRDPAIYSRIEIRSFNNAPEFIRLNGGEVVTNPYGDRNFELHSELSWEMITHLTAEVENAFRVGKRPVKPDIKAMIEAARGD